MLVRVQSDEAQAAEGMATDGSPDEGWLRDSCRPSARYTAPRPSSVTLVIAKPSFFLSAPEIMPRAEWGCHAVATPISAIDAPSGLPSIAMIRAYLVPLRPAIGVGVGVSAASKCTRAGLDLRRLATALATIGSSPMASSPASVIISVVP